MVNFMRPANPHQITIITSECPKAVMNKPIVENEIDNAIYADARTYPKVIVQTDMPSPHQP